jgi:hypothetical protein
MVYWCVCWGRLGSGGHGVVGGGGLGYIWLGCGGRGVVPERWGRRFCLYILCCCHRGSLGMQLLYEYDTVKARRW